MDVDIDVGWQRRLRSHMHRYVYYKTALRVCVCCFVAMIGVDMIDVALIDGAMMHVDGWMLAVMVDGSVDCDQRLRCVW